MRRAETSKVPIVLIVEDDAEVRVLAQSIIGGHGYYTLSAANAREALVLLEEVDIAVLFTDIEMPGDMDGLELARRASERRPGLHVIYTSGAGQTDGMRALFVEGPSSCKNPTRKTNCSKPCKKKSANRRGGNIHDRELRWASASGVERVSLV